MKPALVAAIIMALFIYFAPRSYAQQPTTNGQKQTDNQSSSSSSQIHATTETASANYKSPDWYKSPEWMLVIVGIITAIVIGLQSYYTRIAAEIFIQKERARVEIIAQNPTITAQGNSGVLVTLKNNGPTIGFIEDCSVRLLQAPQDIQPDYSQCIRLGFVGTIQSGATMPGHIMIFLAPNPTLNAAQLVDIRQGGSFVHFYGFVRYRDVYKRLYRRRIHLRYVMNFGLVMPGQITEWWDLAGIREENEDSEENTESWIDRLIQRLDSLSDGPN